MSMYEHLANYYDALVKDDEARDAWVQFVNQHTTGKQLLDMACGSAEIAIALAKQGYDVDAFDQSAEMLKKARQKEGSEALHLFQGDMCEMQLQKKYDTITCFCDSLNYLIKEEQIEAVFEKVSQHLKPNGVFLFDVHSEDRIAEFADEFCESGHIDTIDYEWIIASQGRMLYQNFIFYEDGLRPQVEQHIQYIYSVAQLSSLLEKHGFVISVYTDFDQKGIQKGEKYFFVCRKGEEA